MVDVTGHLGMALLFAAPAWMVWGRRGALGFTGFATVTALLPDSDLYLQHVLPVTHHGVTHTVVFVVIVGVLAGVFAGKWLTERLNAHSRIRSTEIAAGTVAVFASAGLVLGGLSHIFADLLSAPDVAAPLKPLWPFYAEPIVVDLIYYDAPLWNFGLIGVAVGVHVLFLWHHRYPLDHRFRIGGPSGEPDGSQESVVDASGID